MNKLIIFLLLISQIAAAQNISVLSNEKLLDSDTRYCFPHFSPDGNSIALTSENYRGLFMINTKTRDLVQLTDRAGAGYNPVFSEDGTTIYYRWNEYKANKKYSGINSINLISKKTETIESEKRKLSTPQLINNKLVYTRNTEEVKQQTTGKKGLKESKEVWTYTENKRIIVYIDEEKRVLAPKGDGHYLWSELSPDTTKLLFTLAGQGTFVSDLEGNIHADLGYLNASKWLNNHWVVGMKDYDDGHEITESDIFAVSSDGQKTVRLTQTDDKIEMYPDCSPADSKVAYHTLDGEIYLMTLKLK